MSNSQKSHYEKLKQLLFGTWQRPEFQNDFCPPMPTESISAMKKTAQVGLTHIQRKEYKVKQWIRL